MANQPQDMKAFKGQIKFNSGAKPPKQMSMGRAPQNMKRIPHKVRLVRHNEGLKGNG